MIKQRLKIIIYIFSLIRIFYVNFYSKITQIFNYLLNMLNFLVSKHTLLKLNLLNINSFTFRISSSLVKNLNIKFIYLYIYIWLTLSSSSVEKSFLNSRRLQRMRVKYILYLIFFLNKLNNNLYINFD